MPTLPNPIRKELLASSSVSPIALKTCDVEISPVEHADPVELNLHRRNESDPLQQLGSEDSVSLLDFSVQAQWESHPC